jgi:Mg-chelatase subunit ChlD
MSLLRAFFAVRKQHTIQVTPVEDNKPTLLIPVQIHRLFSPQRLRDLSEGHGTPLQVPLANEQEMHAGACHLMWKSLSVFAINEHE